MGWHRNISGGKATAKAVVRTRARASYDAARTTSDNQRHWANVDALSADAAASPEVRRILRNRARYEVANNSWLKGIVLTLANDCIGTGPRLQMLTGQPNVDTFIEREFAAWTRAVRFAQKLRTMRMARTVDGESFAIMGTNPALPTPVKLDLRLIEAEQVTTPDLSVLDANRTDGIRFDAFGNPAGYDVLKYHPGARLPGYGFDYDTIPAAQVIHCFRADRPGQTRGVSDLTPAIQIWAELRRYDQAVIAAAETAADLAGVIQSDASADEDGSQSPEPMDTFDLEKRALLTLPSGWEANQFKAEQPTTSHRDFVDVKINESSRCLNMPFNIAACNSSKYNYSSGRMDHQTYFKSITVDQDELELIAVDRAFFAWFAEAVLIDGYLPELARRKGFDLAHQWFWDGTEHVDPAKEASAQATRLTNNTTTLAAEFARAGLDWEKELRQRAKELALMKELGITPPPQSPQNQRSAQDQADQDEEDEEALDEAA